MVIHRAGVEHHDFYDDDFCHVVVSPKNRYEIRVVDFNIALPHECTAKPIEIWNYEPVRGTVGCSSSDLYDVSSAIGAWTPGQYPSRS